MQTGRAGAPLARARVMLGTPVGRVKARDMVVKAAYPLLALIAVGNRRLLGRRTRVVAVVGSLGKTTTTRVILAALGLREPRHLGGNGYSVIALAMLRLRPWQRHAVQEVGIRQPDQMAGYGRIIAPDVVVVTSIASDHHRSMGSLETTRTEKARMVEALRPGGVAILNGDDPNVRWMRERTNERVVTVGLGAENDVRATDVPIDWPHGTRFVVHAGEETWPVRMRLFGRHQVYPVLFGVAVTRELGLSLDEVLGRMEQVEPTRSRLQVVKLLSGAWLLRDEFKATEETFDAALDVLEQIPARRRVVVLGDVEEPWGQAGDIYRRLGGRLGSIATKLVLTGATQMRRRYAVGARPARLAPTAIVDMKHDLARAAAAAMDDLGPGNVVLVKGRAEQRLARVSLALAGRDVGCTIQSCHLTMFACDTCPMLERGWGKLPVVAS